MLPAIAFVLLAQFGPTERIAGFFRTERECKPFGAVHDCGCALKITPRYLLDDGQGHAREINLDAERVSSYGGPEALEGKWVIAKCETVPSVKQPMMRSFGVIDAGTLNLALSHGDTSVLIGMPPSAKRVILGAPSQIVHPFTTIPKPYLSILCRTSDTLSITPRDPSAYTDMMRSTFPGVSHFIYDMSYGANDLSGSQTVGWINLPKAKSSYTSIRDFDGKVVWDHKKILDDAVQMLDPTVDFSKFSGINVFMNTNDDSGGFYASAYFMTVDGLNGWMPITEQSNGFDQAGWVHETGHDFGFDHSSGPYSTPYDSTWDAMSGGSRYVTDATLGTIRIGNGYNAYHRYKAGWIPQSRVRFLLPGNDKTFRLERLTDPTNGTDPLMAKVYISGSAKHYYTVETRKPVGYDLTVPDAVVIHEVVENRIVNNDGISVTPRFDRSAQVVDPDNNGDPNDAAAQWTPGETFVDAAAGIQISVISGDATGYKVRITVDANQPSPGTVVSGSDDGPGTLRDWFYYKQDFPNANLLFRIPKTDPGYDATKGFFRIRLKTPLPDMTIPGLVIDGGSQTSFTGDTNPKGPEIMLDGTDAGDYTSGLVMKGAGQVVRNLCIANFKYDGIRSDGATDLTVERCFLGVMPDGFTAAGNYWDGISAIDSTVRTTIGGASKGNVISGNGYGIWDTGTQSTKIVGNLIGTDRLGQSAIPNRYYGISLQAAAVGTTVGSAVAGEGNVISGNASGGIGISDANGTVVAGNRVGTNAEGTSAIPNIGWGIVVGGSSTNTTVGGSGVNAGNLLSGNTVVGVGVYGPAVTNSTIEGNFIGVDQAGKSPLGNHDRGIAIFGGPAHTAVRSNLISGNALDGIYVADAATSDVLIEKNFIGTGVDGLIPLSNRVNGALIASASGVVLRSNVISNNMGSGVVLYGLTGATVQNNLVGTDSSGTLREGNWQTGVLLVAGSTNCVIGGAAGLENVICGSGSDGVGIGDAGTTGNHISGNFVGVTRAGAVSFNRGSGVWIGNGASNNLVGEPGLPNVIGGNLGQGIAIGSSGNQIRSNFIGVLPGGDARPNGGDGVYLWGGATGNVVGGIASGEGNRIAFNHFGVSVRDDATVGNSIRGNSISDNAALGIQIVKNDGPNGVTANDAGDLDSGPNDVQNFPILTKAVLGATALTVTGSYSGVPNAAITVDLYASGQPNPSGYGEGQAYLTSKTVTTDASGQAALNFSLPSSIGRFLSATATSANGSTSEFSPVREVVSGLNTLTIDPAGVTGGTNATGTVKLYGPAPSFGTTLALSSSNTAIASVPATVTVPAGSDSATFAIATTPVGKGSSAKISATFDGVVRSATLTVNPPALSQLTVDPASGVGETAFTAHVSISGPASANGFRVNLSVDVPADATIPSFVNVPSGATSVDVAIKTITVPFDVVETVRADADAVSKTASFTIKATNTIKLSVTPGNVVGGASPKATVTLGYQAPAGGQTVALTSDHAEASVPSSVVVPAGSKTVSFSVATSPTPVTLTARLTASANGKSSGFGLTIRAPRVSKVKVSPASAAGGTPFTGTVTLDGVAPTGGVSVALSVDKSAASVPATVTVPAGSATATFNIGSGPVAANTTVAVTASAGGASAKASFTILAPRPAVLTLSPASVVGGQSSLATVTLTGPAPTGGLVVTLTSSKTLAKVPASITVAAGSNSATFTVTTAAVTATTTVVISASANGAQAKGTLEVKPPG